jgi:hypothetical protein
MPYLLDANVFIQAKTSTMEWIFVRRSGIG